MPGLYQILDAVSREIVKNKGLDEMRLYVERLLLGNQHFLDSRHDHMSLVTFVPIDLALSRCVQRLLLQLI